MRTIEQELQEKEYFLPYHYLWNTGTYLGNQYFSCLNKIKQLLRKHNCKNILDVGCGDGRFCFELHDNTIKYIGVDISKRAIQFAKIFNKNSEFYRGDIKNMKFKKKFDGIVLMEVLEHIPLNKVHSFLEKLHKLVEYNKYLFITVPSKIVPKEKKHFQHFDKESLEKTLLPYFTIVKLEYQDKHSAILTIFYKFMFALLAPSDYFSLLKKLRSFTFSFYQKFLTNANKRNGRRLIAVCIKN